MQFSFLVAAIAGGVVCLMSPAYAGGGRRGGGRRSTGSVVDLASNVRGFSTLVNAVSEANLVDALDGDLGTVTVFAPGNRAFRKLERQLGSGTLRALLQDEECLRDLLTYHVVEGAVFSDDIENGRVETVNGEDVRLRVTRRGGVRVNNARVKQADIEVDNGVIHRINRVLIPPGFADDCL